jgi:hypothetical protein
MALDPARRHFRLGRSAVIEEFEHIAADPSVFRVVAMLTSWEASREF